MNKKELILGIVIIIGIMVIALPFASRLPDGLQRVAGDKGFLEKEAKPLARAPLADYLWPGIRNERFSTAAAGIAGIAIVCAAGFCVAMLIGRVRK